MRAAREMKVEVEALPAVLPLRLGRDHAPRRSYPTDRKEVPVSISNRKPGDKKEAPTEPLKRSIAACLRAIARKPDLEVTFASDRPS